MKTQQINKMQELFFQNSPQKSFLNLKKYFTWNNYMSDMMFPPMEKKKKNQ